MPFVVARIDKLHGGFDQLQHREGGRRINLQSPELAKLVSNFGERAGRIKRRLGAGSHFLRLDKARRLNDENPRRLLQAGAGHEHHRQATHRSR